MNTLTVLQEVMGAAFILVGLTTLNKNYIKEVMNGLHDSKALTWLTGVITFLLGVITVAIYNVWSSDWHVIITIIGWLMLLKGAFITLLPNASMSFYRKIGSSTLVMVSGAVVVIIGLVLLYLGITA
jgi:hypothetical protein